MKAGPYLRRRDGRVPRVLRSTSRRSLRALGAFLLALAVACTPTDGRPDAPATTGDRPSLSRSGCADLDRLIARTRRGYVPVRSPEILPIPTEPHYIGKAELPVHTGPWDYLAQVPLVFYGPGVVEGGKTEAPVTLADLAPSLAELIGFEGFEAPDGRPRELDAENTPKLVVTIVWDGAGWNTLREHEGAWPFLKRAMREGISFQRATIGSTPSNTPPIHTTIGTGAFPSTHGVPHVKIRLAGGGYVDPFEGDDASLVRVPSLGDLYDEAQQNRAEVGVVATVNWHLGMIGHGAEYEGGDRDTVVLLNDQGVVYGNPSFYDIADHADTATLQAATEELDGRDGARDGRWNEDRLDDAALRYATPAFTQYQQSVLETTIRREGFGADEIPDLMYVNFKQIDDAGHRWGMTSEQVGGNVLAADDALKRLAGFLDDSVGEGEWVVAVTADHGQTPYPAESGGWPIRGSELNDDIEAALSVKVLRVTSAGIFLTDPEAVESGEADEVARWLIDYTVADNVPEKEELPKEWQERGDTPLFSAVLVGKKVAASACPAMRK